MTDHIPEHQHGIKRPPKERPKLGRGPEDNPETWRIEWGEAEGTGGENPTVPPENQSEPEIETANPAATEIIRAKEKPQSENVNIPLFTTKTYGYEIFTEPTKPITEVGFVTIGNLKDDDKFLCLITNKPITGGDAIDLEKMATRIKEIFTDKGFKFQNVFSHFNSSGVRIDMTNAESELPQFGNALIFELDGRLYELPPTESPYIWELAEAIDQKLDSLPSGAVTLEQSQQKYDCLFIPNGAMKRIHRDQKFNLPDSGYALLPDDNEDHKGSWIVRLDRFSDEDKWQGDTPGISRGLVQYFKTRYDATLEYFDPPITENGHVVKLKISFNDMDKRDQAKTDLSAGEKAAKTRPIDIIAKALGIEDTKQIEIPPVEVKADSTTPGVE